MSLSKVVGIIFFFWNWDCENTYTFDDAACELLLSNDLGGLSFLE